MDPQRISNPSYNPRTPKLKIRSLVTSGTSTLNPES